MTIWRVPMKRALAIAACCLTACSEGNTVDGQFDVRPVNIGELATSTGTSLTRAKEAWVRIALGASVELAVFSTAAPARPVELREVRSDASDIVDATETASGLGLVGKSPGATMVRWRGDGTKDAMLVEVVEPDEVVLLPGCEASSTYWRGVPAVVRYVMRGGEHNPTATTRRVWGVGPVALAEGPFAIDAAHSDAFEWVLTPEADELTLTTTTKHTLALSLQDAPPIDGVAALLRASGEILSHALKLPAGHTLNLRTFPTAGETPLCTTSAPARHEVISGTCTVTPTTSEDGRISVHSDTAGECVVQTTLLPTPGLRVPEDSPTGQHTVRFYQ